MQFLDAEPTGWQAINLAAGRIAWMVAQVHSRRKLREKDFQIRMRTTNTAATERARLEAFAIQSEIREQLAQQGA